MSYIKKPLIALAILCLSPLPLLAQVVIVEVFPNTDDDTNMEYIEIANTGCVETDISGYQLADKEKSYIFLAGSTLTSHGIHRVGRPLSKLVLNNTNEELLLHDRSGNLLQNFGYASSIKGIPIVVSGISYDTCEGGTEENTEEEGSDDGMDTEEESPSEESGGEGSSSSGSVDGGVIDELGEGFTEDILEGEGSGTISEESDTDTLDDTNTTEDEGAEEESMQTSGLLGKSGSLDPQILLYSDEDEDGYIDTLEILYDIFLTGKISPADIYLYSATGGLYDHRVNTATGYILGAEIEDNILRIFIEPATLEKATLHIDATTASALRLKSASTYSITSLSGANLGALFLTSSFDSYHSVYEKSVYEAMLLDIGEIVNTGTILPLSLSPSFPEIIPTIQNYTNTSYIDGEFTCRESPCRLNLNFENIFSSLYPPSEYSCEIHYANTIEYKCNPSQWSPTSATGFDVKILHRATGISQSQYFPIHWNPVVSPKHTTTKSVLADIAIPIAIIRLNGTLTKKQILIEDHILHCYTNTCSVNFDGSDSYDPDKNTMTYTWLSDGNIFSTKKNPGVQDFLLGEHDITFRIIDASGKIAEKTFSIIVRGDVAIDSDLQIANSSKTSNNKKKSIKKFSFFSPPRLILDNPSSKISEVDGRFRCVSTTPTCSMNFSLTDTTPGVLYQFQYAHEAESTWTSNPRSQSLKTGKYTLTVSAHYETRGASVWSQDYPIQIIRMKKASITKKIKIPKVGKVPKSPTKKNLDLIPSAYAEDGDPTVATDRSILFILFLSVLINIFFFRKKLGIVV